MIYFIFFENVSMKIARRIILFLDLISKKNCFQVIIQLDKQYFMHIHFFAQSTDVCLGVGIQFIFSMPSSGDIFLELILAWDVQYVFENHRSSIC